MSMICPNTPIISKQTKILNSRKEVFNNTNFKTFLYKEYEITFNSGRKEYMYSIALEIPITIIKKKILKTIKIFKWEFPIVTKTIKNVKNYYVEIPFRILSKGLYAVYYPQNYVKTPFQDIEISGPYHKLENLKFKNDLQLKDIDKIRNIVQKLNFEIINN